MNDNQILVVHSRWVYNFMGIILEAQVSFIFFRFYAFFSKISLRFWWFSNPIHGGRKSIEKALHANECVRWMEAFIANLGNAENREKVIMTLSHLSFTHTWTIWNQKRDLSLIERTVAMTNELEEIRWKEEYIRSWQNKTIEELRRTLKPKLVDFKKPICSKD